MSLEVLGHVARERRRQVIAQRQPLLVFVLKRKHALVGPVLIGQELAQRVRVLEGRRLQRLEAVALVDVADFRRAWHWCWRSSSAPMSRMPLGRRASGWRWRAAPDWCRRLLSWPCLAIVLRVELQHDAIARQTVKSRAAL